MFLTLERQQEVALCHLRVLGLVQLVQVLGQLDQLELRLGLQVLRLGLQVLRLGLLLG
jgi:hypothetical protein